MISVWPLNLCLIVTLYTCVMEHLYYLMGSSGAGKDSIMHYARSRLASDDRVIFAHRYITRPSNAGGENHIALSDEEFERRLDLGLFCMNWSSHGCQYGLGIEIIAWLDRGVDVVMNGSRNYLAEARRVFPGIAPVLITVSSDVLRERLMARGRESEVEIEKRIQRNLEIDVDDSQAIRVSNDGPLEESGEQFLSILRSFSVSSS